MIENLMFKLIKNTGTCLTFLIYTIEILFFLSSWYSIEEYESVKCSVVLVTFLVIVLFVHLDVLKFLSTFNHN